MRWKPDPVFTDTNQIGVKDYDPLVWQWTATNETRYATRLGAPNGTVSSTAPASLAECLGFDIPQGAEFFGVDLVSVRDGTVGTDTITWTQLKIEAFVVGIGETEADVTFAKDSGRAEEPILWYPSGITPNSPGATTHIIARQFLDVSGGDANVNGVEWLREGAQTVTAISKRSLYFAAFGGIAGLPYVGHYRRIYLILSADPGAVNVTAKYTLNIRPFAWNISDSIKTK